MSLGARLQISHNAQGDDTSAPCLRLGETAEADFISAESLGLTLRRRPGGIDIVTYNYVRAIHRGNSGVYSSSVGRVNFREGSPFARSEGQKRR